MSNLLKEIISKTTQEIMEELNSEEDDLTFYKLSLSQACDEASEMKKEKALKDVVGKVYESHRERLWKHFGFTIQKKKIDTPWGSDWTILKGNKVIAIEEDKGHYLDSCFLERTLTGIAKTIISYRKLNREIPCFIISSFGKYSNFESKLDEFCEILNPSIVDAMKSNIKHKYIGEKHRYPVKEWFQQRKYAFIENLSESLIKKDIMFMKSLL